MDTYIIQKAYDWSDSAEIEIIASNLHFAELGPSHSGCQTSNPKNNDIIRDKCAQIAILIREIERLNKK